MKTRADFSNNLKQQILNDNSLFEGNKLNPDDEECIKKLSENFKRIKKESKQSFVVDWQIPENL